MINFNYNFSKEPQKIEADKLTNSKGNETSRVHFDKEKDSRFAIAGKQIDNFKNQDPPNPKSFFNRKVVIYKTTDANGNEVFFKINKNSFVKRMGISPKNIEKKIYDDVAIKDLIKTSNLVKIVEPQDKKPTTTNVQKTIEVREIPKDVKPEAKKNVAMQPSVVEKPLVTEAKAANKSSAVVEVKDSSIIGEGIGMPEGIEEKLLPLLNFVKNKSDHEDLIWLSKGNNRVFSLKEYPNLIFKMPADIFQAKSSNELRFNNMAKAWEVCQVNKLNLLIIPNAKKIEIGGHELIVEQQLDIKTKESAQEENYHVYSKNLNETARQLAIFVAKTGFKDVAWRNIPLIEEKDDYMGDRRVALIDIEDMGNAYDGFFGGYGGSRGLLNCFSEEQTNIILEEATRYGFKITSDSKAVQERHAELKVEATLRDLYAEKGTSAKEKLVVDLDSLPIDLNEKGSYGPRKNKVEITKRELAEILIETINKEIANKSDDESLKGTRNVFIHANGKELNKYRLLGMKDIFSEEGNPWVDEILLALKDQGYLFSAQKTPGDDWILQVL